MTPDEARAELTRQDQEYTPRLRLIKKAMDEALNRPHPRGQWLHNVLAQAEEALSIVDTARALIRRGYRQHNPVETLARLEELLEMLRASEPMLEPYLRNVRHGPLVTEQDFDEYQAAWLQRRQRGPFETW